MHTFKKVLVAGFLFGSLTYGSTLAFIHLVYNGVDSARNGLAVGIDFNLLYGLWALLVFAIVYVLVNVIPRIWGGAARDPLGRGMLWGLFLFNFVFWTGCALYGLTYDQGPFGPIATRFGMVCWIATLLAGAAVGSWLLSLLLLAATRWFSGARRPRRILLVAYGLWLALFALAPLAMGGDNSNAAPVPSGPLPQIKDNGVKVALIGIDGATWRVIGPMLSNGELPNFKRMIEQGASGELETFHGSNSAVIWASIYTGRLPEDDGVLDFYRIHLPGMSGKGIFPVHRTYFKEWVDLLSRIGLAHRRSVDRGSLDVASLWEILNHLKIPLGVVSGYFYSFPALTPAAQPGYFLSWGVNAFMRQVKEGVGGPERRADLPLFVQPPELFPLLHSFLAEDDFFWERDCLLTLLKSEGQPRFLNFYTHQPDIDQHLYWKWYQPRLFFDVHRDKLIANRDKIPHMYRDIDKLLGALHSELDPNTVVIVISDHGQAPTMLHSYYTQHRHGPPGVIFMAGGPIKHDLELDHAQVLDIFPTVLYLLGVPVPEVSAGRVLTEAIDPEFLRQHPIARIPTYDGMWERTAKTKGSGLDHQVIERLRALGYI